MAAQIVVMRTAAFPGPLPAVVEQLLQSALCFLFVSGDPVGSGRILFPYPTRPSALLFCRSGMVLLAGKTKDCGDADKL